MKKLKKLTRIANILIVLGIIISGVSFIVAKGNLENYTLASQRYVLNEFSAEYEIAEIKINEYSHDITIREGNVDEVAVSYYENESEDYRITENGGILEIERQIGDLNLNAIVDDSETDTVITVPKGWTGKITVDGSSSDVEIYGISPESVTVNTESGEVELAAVKSDKIVIETSSGEVEFENLECDDISLKTSSGDIEGNILAKKSDYKITVKTSSGDSNLKNTETGDKTLNITTSSGDVEIEFD